MNNCVRPVWSALLAVGLLTAPGLAQEADAPKPISAVPWTVRAAAHGLRAAGETEAGRMVRSILSGSRMGPGEGWFGPSKSRLGWSWLADQCDANGDGRISADEFDGPDGFFPRLDRDGDGAIEADDFDWSRNSPYVKRMAYVQTVFREFDLDANGKMSVEEWNALYQAMSDEGRELSPVELGRLLLGQAPERPKPAGENAPKGGPPSPRLLIQGLLAGEVGSFREGPDPGDKAPDFTLLKEDESGIVTLSEMIGPRPVILVFGSFT